MPYIPILPPGCWLTPADETHWGNIIEHHEAAGEHYRQQIYLAMTDQRMAARMANPEYRARIEREHKRRCDSIDAAALAHLKRSYRPDSGAWDADFELHWVLDDGLDRA